MPHLWRRYKARPRNKKQFHDRWSSENEEDAWYSQRLRRSRQDRHNKKPKREIKVRDRMVVKK